ncbi:endonuclease V [Chitinophaga niastensis]|uniref:endonuclease V n=1 Tax=Chitinophaga niastensis TaxID=536980 RepID=UPI001304D07B|nr:endonuclease V [Chitinophaga niastensis]
MLLNYETLEVMEVSSHCMEVTFPYIPGLFSFREMPPLLRAYEKLTRHPSVMGKGGRTSVADHYARRALLEYKGPSK